ncbi:uncharacterized protein [Clytia hemisphaerica]|uniref:Uncharacterized protein n=1 Tax=Clytia hemisphaerica TaxID=252671 RepID=A0A7M5WZF6_9CNID
MHGTKKNDVDIKISTDYRSWIWFKYIYIGCADICFWWTVWNIADHLWPMDITTDGALSYVRGYMLIIAANLYYLLQRLLFRETCHKFYETRDKHLHPACIVTEEEVIRNKPIRFQVLKKVLTLMIWMVVVGFIQVWRGLFATFDYVVDLLHLHFDINKILSSVIFQLIVGITLAFTQRNNAVNLCPTHKIYKYDELEEMDGLFSLHVFENLLLKDDQKTSNTRNSKMEIKEAQTSVPPPPPPPPTKSRRKFSPLNSGFDLPQYAARKMSGQLHRSSSTNSLYSQRKASQSSKNSDMSSVASTVYQDSTPPSCKTSTSSLQSTESTEGRKMSRVELDFNEKNKRKISTMSFLNAPSFEIIEEEQHENEAGNSFPDQTMIGIDNKNFLNTEVEDEIPMHKLSEQSNTLFIDLKDIQDNNKEENADVAEAACDISLDVIGGSSTEEMSTSSESFMQHVRRASFRRRVHFEELDDKDSVDSLDLNATTGTEFRYNHCKVCLFISILTYIYTIHHRQVFLHIFGGMFWSTTWKLFDFATESIFTKTASDIPGLVLIAIFCHSMNHLVLFRFKEMATKLHWKTFWEFFCGLFTVCLWAPTWYVWDVIAEATGYKLYFQIGMHVLSFLSLVYFNVSINLAL